MNSLLRKAADLNLRVAGFSPAAIDDFLARCVALPQIKGLTEEEKNDPLAVAGAFRAAYDISNIRFTREELTETFLVLSGGGTKGSFQVGALSFLSSHWKKLRIKYVVGASTGALNALALSANGSKGVDVLVAAYNSIFPLYHATDTYNEINSLLRTHFGTNLRALLSGGSSTGSMLQDISSLLSNAPTLGAAVGLGFGLLGPFGGAVVGGLLGDWARDDLKPKIDALIRILGLVQSATGIYQLNNVRETFRRELSIASAGKNGKPKLYAAVVGLSRGQLGFVDEQGYIVRSGSRTRIDHPEPVIEGVIASASIPGIFEPRMLGSGEYYVDGGVREMVPLRKALSLAAASRAIWKQVIVIGASPMAMEVAHFDNRDIGIPTVAARAISVMVNEINRGDLATEPSSDVNVIRIYPNEDILSGALEWDCSLFRINMGYGYMRAFLLLDAHLDRLLDFATGWHLLFAHGLIESLTRKRLECLAIEREGSMYRPMTGPYSHNFIFSQPTAEAQPKRYSHNLSGIRELRRRKRAIFESLEWIIRVMPTNAFLPIEIDAPISAWWEQFEEKEFQQFDLWGEFVSASGAIVLGSERPPIAADGSAYTLLSRLDLNRPSALQIKVPV